MGDGDIYYWNVVNNKVTWDRPSLPPPPVPNKINQPGNCFSLSGLPPPLPPKPSHKSNATNPDSKEVIPPTKTPPKISPSQLSRARSAVELFSPVDKEKQKPPPVPIKPIEKIVSN